MKTLIKSLPLFAASLLIFCSLSNSASAQNQIQNQTAGAGATMGNGQMPSAQDRATRQTQMMVKNLGLNDDQAQKVSGINMKYAKMMDSVRTASNGDRQAMGQSMRSMRDSRDADMKTVLSADQFKNYQTMQQQMRQRMQNGGGAGNGAQGGGNTAPMAGQ